MRVEETEMARAFMHLNRMTTMACANENQQQQQNEVQVGNNSSASRVLILGGTGRVGGSTAIALSKLCPDLRIVVAGRNR